ncbi:hypothetical protein [Clostridium butyricum]|uniref:hypothetical protein n=1 Tax=Clostridium butyricum TaxID=1492 RepID=UPI0005C2294D|nr:hypothetical protein [Clostridium butyricum]HCW54175.1 hypothetical protein [Clostridium sp.]MBA8967631.1 uncharacterized membrane-anchored protein YhcB (DUF1043 family) [Clostridium butyricum]MBA8971302.1 uncharacterized membrane-anchored protein YhcB (DUF1043 family) [Clostridium butyricum]MBC2429365.1 hypothetical protein [Clostridium butyricum]NOW36832.1 uncharacterized membrane-anchored protein YhcB (DUF1043 family) [Clostridium butyricum]
MGEIMLPLMLILDLFGIIYVYQLVRKYANKVIEKKRQQQFLKENETTIEEFKTKISDDFKLESEVLCDKILKKLG